MASDGNWSARRLFHLCAYDHMLRTNKPRAAELFAREVGLGNNPNVSGVPDGLLADFACILLDTWQSLPPRADAESSTLVDPTGNNGQNGNGVPVLAQDMHQQVEPQCSTGTAGGSVIGQAGDAGMGPNVGEASGSKQSFEDLSFDVGFLGFENVTTFQPPSSHDSYSQHHMADTAPQENPRDTSCSLDLGNRSGEDLAISGDVNRSLPSNDHQDAGMDGRNNLLPPEGWPSTEMGEYTAGINFSNFDAFSPVPTQEPHFWSSTLSEDLTKPQGERTSNIQQSDGIGTQVLPIPGTSDQCIKDSEMHVPIEEISRPYLIRNDENSGFPSPSTHIQRCTPPRKISEPNGLTFEETKSFGPTNDKLLCCHFSACGKLLASAGHEKKVFIWSLQNSELVHSLEGHSDVITDVRFRRMSSLVATSSLDGTIKIWDCRKPRKPLSRLLGHAQPVNSVDFHPIEVGVLASCDSSGEIRIWNVDERLTKYNLMGGTRQVRFQPRIGKYLAAASGNKVNLFDLEDGGRHICLEGHIEEVRSLSWESDGKHLASVSADSAHIWSVGPDVKSKCALHSSGSNKFESCAFHPGYCQMLAIGSFQTISLWNPAERDNPNYTASLTAHDGVVAALSDSTRTEMLASASHDGIVKLWK